MNNTTSRKRVARISYQSGGWRWQDDIEPAGAVSYSAAYGSKTDVVLLLRLHAMRAPEPYTHYRIGNRSARKL